MHGPVCSCTAIPSLQVPNPTQPALQHLLQTTGCGYVRNSYPSEVEHENLSREGLSSAVNAGMGVFVTVGALWRASSILAADGYVCDDALGTKSPALFLGFREHAD